MTHGNNLTAACRGTSWIGALGIGMMIACTTSGARADMNAPQPQAPAQAAQSAQHTLTFPPTDNCSFLGGDAGAACEKRRGADATEIGKVRSGEIKTLPPAVQSSGGPYTPLSNQGGLAGSSSGELSPIGPSENVSPSSGGSYNPNSIGNPWAGTPYDNGTGMHSH
jgi:hypothetical protein